MQRCGQVIPWKTDVKMPDYNAFLTAAYTRSKKTALFNQPSTLNRIVNYDGSVEVNGVLISAEKQVDLKAIYANSQLVQLADELVLGFIENYKYNHVDVTSKVVSRVRDRSGKEK